MPPILQHGEQLIAKGVAWTIVVRVLVTLLPQALGVTIPMALLSAILFGLGRLSADREFVALQACGVSVFRLLRPIALLAAIVARAATAYDMIVALPDANQTFREITFNIIASARKATSSRASSSPDFPNRVALRARHAAGTGGGATCSWPTRRSPTRRRCTSPRPGRLVIDRGKQTVELVLEDGTRTRPHRASPTTTTAAPFEQLVLSIDRRGVFPRTQMLEGRQRDDDRRAAREDRREHQGRQSPATASSSRSSRSSRCRRPAWCWR